MCELSNHIVLVILLEVVVVMLHNNVKHDTLAQLVDVLLVILKQN